MSHIDWANHYYHWYRVFSKRVSIGRSERFSFLFFFVFLRILNHAAVTLHL